MQQTKSNGKKTIKRMRPWRKNPKVWTDTFYARKMLNNPHIMTTCELANALAEHQRWRLGQEKYNWQENPIKENREDEAPFSPPVLTNLLYEAIVRLGCIGDMTCGRYKSNVQI